MIQTDGRIVAWARARLDMPSFTGQLALSSVVTGQPRLEQPLPYLCIQAAHISTPATTSRILVFSVMSLVIWSEMGQGKETAMGALLGAAHALLFDGFVPEVYEGLSITSMTYHGGEPVQGVQAERGERRTRGALRYRLVVHQA